MSYPQQPYPPQPPPRRRHDARNVILIIAGALAVIIAASVAISAAAGNGRHPAAAGTSAAPAAAPAAQAAAPAPVPSPAGTGAGSCDYTLGDNPAGDPSTAVATAEVDLTNTGNVGTVVRVTVGWPQEGYAPLTMTRTVRMPYGASGAPVSFHMPLTSTQLDNLQNWQLGHTGQDGCTYSETILRTYGPAH